VVSGLAIAGGAPLYSIYENHKKIDISSANLAQVQSALNTYYQNNGYLPCPAPRNVAVDTAGYGTDIGTCSAATTGLPIGSLGDGTARAGGYTSQYVRIGAVPVRTLGLPDNVDSDGWGNRLIYAVTEIYANAAAAPSDMNEGEIAIVDSKGNNATGNPGNVVYAVIAQYSDTRGAYNSNGTLVGGAACPSVPASITLPITSIPITVTPAGASLAGLNCSATDVFAATTLTSQAKANTFTDTAVYATGTGCVNTILGSTCSNGSEAHIYIYDIYGHSSGGQFGNVNYMVSTDIKKKELYTANIDVPDQFWKKGFPDDTSLKQFFGACYDGTYTAPTSGYYAFASNTDDGAEVWMDGNPALPWTGLPATEFNGNPGNPVMINQQLDTTNHQYGDNANPITDQPYEKFDNLPTDYRFKGYPNPFFAITSSALPPPSPIPPGSTYAYYMAAGPHTVVVKYYQAWPSYMAAQIFVFPPDPVTGIPANVPILFTGETLADPSLTYLWGPPPNYLMQLTAPQTSFTTTAPPVTTTTAGVCPPAPASCPGPPWVVAPTVFSGPGVVVTPGQCMPGPAPCPGPPWAVVPTVVTTTTTTLSPPNNYICPHP